jgi:ammonia channel protein AmtB
VAITPAAGVVAGWGAICIGFASGTIPVRPCQFPDQFPSSS